MPQLTSLSTRSKGQNEWGGGGAPPLQGSPWKPHVSPTTRHVTVPRPAATEVGMGVDDHDLPSLLSGMSPSTIFLPRHRYGR